MHYLSVIHCLAIILLVFFFPLAFCSNSMPLAKQESFFIEAKIKIGEYQIFHIVCVTENYTER